MVKFAKQELLEFFFLEVTSYIPAIRQGLDLLALDRAASTTIEELHRLFHNIKGAASQVQLSDLSKGAKVVETALNVLLAEKRPISDPLLTALHETADLLILSSNDKNHFLAAGEEGHNFYEQVEAIFSTCQGDEAVGREQHENNRRQEYVHDVRSIFPLLQELAGCLDGGDTALNRAVYGKLAHAVSLLSATLVAASMQRQGRLMQDFQLVLGELSSTAITHQPEMSGLMQDFLRFLEASFSHEDQENNTTIHRVQQQLERCKVFLAPPEQMQEDLFFLDEALDVDALSAFADPAGDDSSVDFLNELVGTNFIEDQAVDELDGELLDEPVDEDQLLLQAIFCEECDEHFIVINRSLNHLEGRVKEPSVLTQKLRTSVGEMRRAVHTLKGAASMTRMNLLAGGAHALEDLLDWLHDEAEEILPEEVRLIATGIDVIETLSQSPEATDSPRLDSVVAVLKKYLHSRSKPADTEAASTDQPVWAIVEKPAATEQSVFVDEPIQPEPAGSAIADVALPGDATVLRVRMEDLNELVSIECELVVARGAMEKMVEAFCQTLDELGNVKENLRRKSQELELGFEVQSLYGFNSLTAENGNDVPIADGLADFDPIELDRYSQLHLIIRSLNEISVDVNSIHASLTALAGDIGGQVGKQQLTMRLMQDKLMRIRMTPLSSISRVLFRTVRDTAAKLGKKATLRIRGEDVVMDRFVWAGITDPLMHILRNGVDHGIESAEVRAAAGKPETGTIILQAEQRSRNVVLRIADDGGGIDMSLVRGKISRDGLAEKPETLDEKELLEYLFHPSFTTRQQITTLSGRGVGLDVVRQNISNLHGSIQIHNTPGQGVEFEIHIPFTLSVNRAALVSVAGREFAVPLQDILQVKHFSAAELVCKDDTAGLFLPFGGALVEVTNLGYHLQLEKKLVPTGSTSEGILAILFMQGEEQCAVAVEAIVEQREIVVKNLGSHLTHVRGISGVTLTGSGGIIPILNLRELVAIHMAGGLADSTPLRQMESTAPPKVLIVDDSISVRHSVARLVESQGWQQLQAVDGRDALAKMDSFLPDVIILDIEMPRMNGYEFKSSLNNQPLYKDIPVVMITSRASEKHQKKARELGITHYLTKPYGEDAFVRLLENIRSGLQVRGR
jgi:chemosensory pili system protein ChpA (sensor histidine kinase/response regulator)